MLEHGLGPVAPGSAGDFPDGLLHGLHGGIGRRQQEGGLIFQIVGSCHGGLGLIQRGITQTGITDKHPNCFLGHYLTPN